MTTSKTTIHFPNLSIYKRMSFTQKIALHKRMIDILLSSDTEPSQTAAEKLKATLEGMQGIKYSAAETVRKEIAFEMAKHQLIKEGVLSQNA
ncbi:hypothetical protein [Vibrio misgurnus]|uniref:hypothetical protein n=1 Tax=Vibrio misgurnus TaxID=2993714 RepID=UPI0023F76A0C|nr:hypothetical protein [Vibrio sp. VCS]